MENCMIHPHRSGTHEVQGGFLCNACFDRRNNNGDYRSRSMKRRDVFLAREQTSHDDEDYNTVSEFDAIWGD